MDISLPYPHYMAKRSYFAKWFPKTDSAESAPSAPATAEAATVGAGALPNAPELFHFTQIALNIQIMIMHIPRRH
jgi:hypothetical protein